MTAQPLAASSYGALQVLLEKWTGTSTADQQRVTLMNSVLSPDTEPIFALFQDFARGVKLGAILHQAQYRQPTLQKCGPCTSDTWTKMWDKVFRTYNAQGDGYKEQPLGDIIRNGKLYEPRP
jgi:hypothetical protein